MKSYDIEEYIAAECPQFIEGRSLMVVLHNHVRGKICDTGCCEFNGGSCIAYKKLIAPPSARLRQTESTETVRAEAERREVSIKQVRRERRDAQNVSSAN